MSTEITIKTIYTARNGWVLYGPDCAICLALRFRRPLEHRGFGLAPLGSDRRELKLIPRDARVLGGADALLHLARFFPWTLPLALAAGLPGMRPLLRVMYHTLAANRHRFGRACRGPHPLTKEHHHERDPQLCPRPQP